MNSSRLAIWKSNKIEFSRSCLFLSFFLATVLAIPFFTLAGRADTEGAGEGESAPSLLNEALEKIGPSFSFRAAYWNRDKSYSERRHFPASSLWLNLRPEEILGAKIFFDGVVGRNDSFRAKNTYAEMREFYVERSFGNLDIKIGRQILVWGRADKVNPTDQWTVRNFTFLTTDDEDQRLGAFGAQVAYNFAEYRLIGIYQPEWRQPVYPIPPINGISLSYRNPRATFRQYGLKFDHSGGGFDWSVSFANLIAKIPSLSVAEVSARGTALDLNFETVQIIGGDFATTVGDFGLRGEFAYTRSHDGEGTDPTKFNSELFGVLGSDYSFFENFNFNVQALYKHVFEFQSPEAITQPNLKLLAVQENLIANQLGSHQLGYSLRPSFKMWNDTLEFEVALVQWVAHYRRESAERPGEKWKSDGGGLVRPKVTYALSDHTKLLFGAEKYFGPSSSFFGRLSDVSSIFAEVRFNF